MRTITRVVSFVAAVNLVIGATAWISGPTRAQQRETPGRVALEQRVLSSLNDCIQERFKDIKGGFGMSRIAKPVAHGFRPENVREMASVRELELANLEVVFYLAGRRGIIKGPVAITASSSRAASSAAPPSARDVWDESQQAMRLFTARESHEFVNSGWTFVARPVRASDQICLRCHRSATGPALQLGDAIGAALYGYRKVQ
jgi:hypothetical protein